MLRIATSTLALLLALATVSEARLVYSRGSGKNGALMAARNDGSGATQIGRGNRPWISPDGHRVAFFRPASYGANLYLVGIGGRHQRAVAIKLYGLSGGSSSQRVAWSEDSGRLVAGRYGAGIGSAYLLDLRKETRRQIGRGDSFAGASFKPGGSRFVVGDQTDRDFVLGVFSFGPFKRSQLTEGRHPVWGPPGIAFDRWSETYGSVHLRKRNGEIRTILKELSSSMFPVDWSRDGRYLLIAKRIESGALQAILFDRSNGVLTRVPADLADVWDLSRDGSLILAERGGDVVSVTPDGDIQVLAEDAEHPTWTK